MAEPADNAFRIEYASGYVERLAMLPGSEPVVAAEDGHFRELLTTYPDIIDPNMVVRRTWSRAEEVALQTARVVKVTHFTADAHRILTEVGVGANRSAVGVTLLANRRYGEGRLARNQQMSSLDFNFANGGAPSIGLSGNPPFDPEFVRTIEAEWARWGLLLDYTSSEQGGYYGFRIMGDAVDKFGRRLTQLLHGPNVN